jgi:hypothetical protein
LVFEEGILVVRWNKRLDPVGEGGLTDTQQAVARRWGEVLKQVPRLAEALEREDFEAAADRGERLAELLDALWHAARVADRAPLPPQGALLAAVDPETLGSPVGQALHG